MDVYWDSRAIAALTGEAYMRDLVDKVGAQVAETARGLAPKDTGAGAASIHHTVERDRYGWSSRVSWDREHDYMFHVETGTSDTPARPFLRPAIKKR
jgi:HK97 gp10 family phage protein